MALLTVRENIYFSASLRLPSSMSREEKTEKVDKLIDELGLSKVANSKVCFVFVMSDLDQSSGTCIKTGPACITTRFTCIKARLA